MSTNNQNQNSNAIIAKALWIMASMCIILGTVSLTMPGLFLDLPGVNAEELKIGGILLIVFGIGDAVFAKFFASKRDK